MPHTHATVAVVGVRYVGLPRVLALGNAFREPVRFELSANEVQALPLSQVQTNRLPDAETQSCAVNCTTHAMRPKDPRVLVVTLPTPGDENRKPVFDRLEKNSTTVRLHMKRCATAHFEFATYAGVIEELCGLALARTFCLVQGKDFLLGYVRQRFMSGDTKKLSKEIFTLVTGKVVEVVGGLSQLHGTVYSKGGYLLAGI